MSRGSQDTSGSISAMIQRFRTAQPSSREQRQAQRQRGELREMWWVDQEQAEQPRSDKPEPSTVHPMQVLDAASVVAGRGQPGELQEQTRRGESDLMFPPAPAVPSLDALMSREIQAAEERLRRQFNVPREPTIPSGFAPVQRYGGMVGSCHSFTLWMLCERLEL